MTQYDHTSLTCNHWQLGSRSRDYVLRFVYLFVTSVFTIIPLQSLGCYGNYLYHWFMLLNEINLKLETVSLWLLKC